MVLVSRSVSDISVPAVPVRVPFLCHPEIAVAPGSMQPCFAWASGSADIRLLPI